jgi:hypothetical protein
MNRSHKVQLGRQRKGTLGINYRFPGKYFLEAKPISNRSVERCRIWIRISKQANLVDAQKTDSILTQT